MTSRLAARLALPGLAAAIFAGCGAFPPDGEAIVVSVGAREVTRAELDRFLGSRTVLGGTVDAPLLSALLDDFVREQLLLIAAEEAGVEISRMQLLAEAAALEAGPGTDAVRPDDDPGPPDGSGGEAAGGNDSDWLRSQVEGRLLVDRFLETRVLDGIEATEEALQLEYETNRAFYTRPETIRVSERRFDSRAAAEAAVARLREGDSSDEFAPVGTFRRGELPDAVDQAVFGLDPGDSTGAVQTAEGFRVFRVDQRLPAGSLEFEDVADVVRLTVLRREADNRVSALLADLQRLHPVAVHVDNLAFPYVGNLDKVE